MSETITFNLEKYLTNGVAEIVRNALKATFTNPKESSFILKYAVCAKNSSKIRQRYELEGQHIPPFLIASITSKCNLHCTGCYARANHLCNDNSIKNQLTDTEWEKIFIQARELGICFILLAGGEPLVRSDIINIAAKYTDIIFPVFTNGTMMDTRYLNIFDKSRNIIPILSIEGSKEQTQTRRGVGVYEKIETAMTSMHKKNILFGISITVTKFNAEYVTSDDFVLNVAKKGCQLIFYVNFVSTDPSMDNLMPDKITQEYIMKKTDQMRIKYTNMLFICFPGDEKSSGGCLAAGRGFFHINPYGGAEPCPFAPLSDFSLKDHDLKDALNSDFFKALQSKNILNDDHNGGCVLYEKRDEVKELFDSLS